MISVVMPLYNKEVSVVRTVNSVLEQTFTDFELIIINDGSTDNSLGLVESFDDRRIQVISTKNRGAAAARNLGIAKAANSYVALLDADDWWDATYLAEIKNAIGKFSENKLFVTGRVHVFAEKEIEYANPYLPTEGEIGLVNHFQVISKFLPAMHSSNITFQKDYFLEKAGFNEKIKHFEDHECWLRLALEQPIIFLNKPLSFYNKTAPESLSQSSVASSDLHYYFQTMLVIKELLSGKDKRCFKKFYQRFATWSYLKYAPTYSEKERLLLQESLSRLLSKPEVTILNSLQKAGIAAIYQKAKKMGSSGR